ncbi:MAG: LysM peptidoglycan-binding domain-containing protein [Anaerolineales bacterium]
MEHATFIPVNLAKKSRYWKYWIIFVAFGMGLACTRSGEAVDISSSLPIGTTLISPAKPSLIMGMTGQPTPFLPDAKPADTPTSIVSTPTLDPTRVSLISTTGPGSYVVQPGDTIGSIAARFGVSPESIIQLNQLSNPSALEVGQILMIPVPESEKPGPNFKIIPDSELVYGPAANGFDPAEFLKGKQGYLQNYREVVNDRERTGPELILFTAEQYSVNPRILMAVLEYAAGWISNSSPSAEKQTYPFIPISGKENLYKQLAWAADQLNYGYYHWKTGGTDYWTLSDQSIVRVGSGINAGTAGVQYLMAQIYGREDWLAAVSESGVFATYSSMFGYPFLWSIDPVVPPDLVQPPLMLPFEEGVHWYFTGGPHGGWASGSAWAAIDFAPTGIALGCVPSDDWVVASAPGLVVHSDEGAVVEDLDSDGNEHSGWTILYMHIETRDRVPLGTHLKLADHIGHPSCEGGFANGTHTHLARRFNGEWIAADGPIPFVLSGWVASGTGTEYDGYLTKGDQTIEACDCGAPANEIWR